MKEKVIGRGNVGIYFGDGSIDGVADGKNGYVVACNSEKELFSCYRADLQLEFSSRKNMLGIFSKTIHQNFQMEQLVEHGVMCWSIWSDLYEN